MCSNGHADFPILIRSKHWMGLLSFLISNAAKRAKSAVVIYVFSKRSEMHLCRALWAEAQLSQVVLKRAEFFIPLSLSLSAAPRQARDPLAARTNHLRQMHSNQFIIYFIIIPWLQFEADSFLLFKTGSLFDSWTFFSFPLLCFLLLNIIHICHPF